MKNFRDQLISASLKRLTARALNRTDDGFRDQLISASLKLHVEHILRKNFQKVSEIS